MPYRMVSADGDLSFELRPGVPLVLGRALSSDLPVLDPTVSRRHAELQVESESVSLRDLGSSNGTFVNGIGIPRDQTMRLTPGDRIVFGRVLFELRELSPVLVDDASAAGIRRAARAGTTIIRQVPVPDADQALERALRASGAQRAIGETAPLLPQYERDRLRLMLLLEVSKALTRPTDRETLLRKIVEFIFRLVDVERAAVLLVDDKDELQLAYGSHRDGSPISGGLPVALARGTMEERVAVLSDNVAGGNATGHAGLSRSAACVPLMGSEARVLGVLYVDSPATMSRVTNEDLDFLVAFAGIGAVAIDNLRFAERSREEALIRSNFERFFAPSLAARIAATRDEVRPGGERKNVAVLFADVRNFTPLAARLAPDETANILSQFFTEMVDCVFQHGGTLDKFIGDAVMAQWGAPISSPADADSALDAALSMVEAVADLNARWRAEGRPELAVGIGLNYGEAFAGHIGSEKRLEYTVIGDAVNTARRICDWAEGGEVLISDSMRAALSGERRLTPHEPLTLRGKREPVTVYRAMR
jgi:adenylate cyclase